MARVPGQPALKRAIAGISLLIAVLLLLWSLWPGEAPQVADTPTTTPIRRAVPVPVRTQAPAPLPDAPLDSDMLLEAARGDHGLALRNRVCRFCVDGTIDDERACKYCYGLERAGRVEVDLVGDDGRPIKDFDGGVSADCVTQLGWGNGGHMDLPEGPCTLRPYRFDGALMVHGPPVEVQVQADGAFYQLLEVPAAPHGGVGLSLSKADDGFLVEGLIPATAAMDAGGFAGMHLTGIDGTDLDADLDLQDVLDMLIGPRGTEVEVTFVDADGKFHTRTLDRRQILGQQLSNLSGQPG